MTVEASATVTPFSDRPARTQTASLIVARTPRSAQEPAAVAETPANPVGVDNISLWKTISSGGIIAYLILLMSLISTALIIEHYISITRKKLMPPALIEQLHECLETNKHQEACDACEADGSYLGQVIGSGLTQIGAMFGFFDMQNAMQEASEREISKYHRKLEYLSFIAASAPMMGLLGTVTGMIEAFNQIAITEGTARPSQLAGGISEALVTTCLGLIVAIPTMFFASFFRNRIESYIAEAESVTEKIMGRFRKQSGA